MTSALGKPIATTVDESRIITRLLLNFIALKGVDMRRSYVKDWRWNITNDLSLK